MINLIIAIINDLSNSFYIRLIKQFSDEDRIWFEKNSIDSQIRF